MKTRQLKMPEVKTQFFSFIGGLDQVTPPIQMANGSMRNCVNVEIGPRGGYARCAGYERYSGKARPSAATYSILACVLTGAVVPGNILTDNAGTSYGTVIAVNPGEVVLTMTVGDFSVGNIKVGGVVVGTSSGPAFSGNAATAALDAFYVSLAANNYRASISAVPGSGRILGVHQYKGLVYAFRNNAGGTAAVMHKSSGAGWVPVSLGRQMAFTSGGNYEVMDGDTIVGATSGATAIITRVALTSGAWAAGTAAGTFIFSVQTGSFTAAENVNVGANMNVATVTANSTAITLLPNGRYEFQNYNFGGQLGTLRMYGVDGVNRGFEFDGTVFVPIRTGMVVDAPKYLKIHRKQIFYAFGSSLQHSGIGLPYAFDPLFGGNEIATGDDITGMVILPGSETSGAMAVYTKNNLFVLYGNDDNDFNLVCFGDESGAVPYTMQYVRNAMALDTQGIIELATTQKFGNFLSAIISDRISEFMTANIQLAVASCISRKKNQYRLFFSSGDAVYVSYNQDKIMGLTTLKYAHDVACISSLEGASGQEEIYFGSSDGFVYQAEVGTSFDGGPIDWLFELAFNHFGGPRQLKTFRKSVFEMTGNGYAEFSFSSSLAYGSLEFALAPTAGGNFDFQGAIWDTMTWDKFRWDGVSLAPSEAETIGTAENISLLFFGASDQFLPFTFYSSIMHFTPRRQMR